MRGHFDAYSAKTGQLVWRTWNTPDPTQLPFILTYGNPAEAATAGSASWSLPAIDNALGKVYYGTGNRYPETGTSPGKFLWSDSIKTVSILDGSLKWYFQTTHHDEWDYDVSNPPVRINPVINGKTVPIVAIGGKNGFLYVLNANNGGPVPNFKIPEVAVPNINNGAGAALNSAWPTQPEPQGAAGQVFEECMTPAEAAANFPGFPTAPNGTPMIARLQLRHSVVGRVQPLVPRRLQLGSRGVRPRDRMTSTPARRRTRMHTRTLSPTSPTQLSIVSNGAGGRISAVNLSTNKLDWQVKLGPSYDTPGGPVRPQLELLQRVTCHRRWGRLRRGVADEHRGHPEPDPGRTRRPGREVREAAVELHERRGRRDPGPVDHLHGQRQAVHHDLHGLSCSRAECDTACERPSDNLCAFLSSPHMT